MTGYDASGRVDDLAAQQSKPCTSIAIGQCTLHVHDMSDQYIRLYCVCLLGSAEGFNLAEKAISSASKSGR